jgi:hypothetical protein
MSHLEATKLFTDPALIETKFSAVPHGQTQKNLYGLNCRLEHRYKHKNTEAENYI